MKRAKEQINSKSGFKDPSAIKEQREIDKPKEGKNSPWDFRCPKYDQRSSSFLNAGTDYGIGYNQPAGHQGNLKSQVAELPRDRRTVVTMRIDNRG